MNKILVLVFVSAAFFFGCSSDSLGSGSVKPPEWDGMPSIQPGSNTPSGGGGGGGSGYCDVYVPGYGWQCIAVPDRSICEDTLDGDFYTSSDCY